MNISALTLLRMRYKINLKFFDEDYFNRIFNISFAEALLEQIKKHDFSKKVGAKNKSSCIKKEVCYTLPQIEMLKKLRGQFIQERDSCNNYVKILSEFLDVLDTGRR